MESEKDFPIAFQHILSRQTNKTWLDFINTNFALKINRVDYTIIAKIIFIITLTLY